MSWKDDQKWESDWWGNCTNTYHEETKQLVYAKKIGLRARFDFGHYPVYSLKGISVLDIGGGPSSILLKCEDVLGSVVDPCDYPQWIRDRYKEAGIAYHKETGETYEPDSIFDEVWIYNVLQHTIDPELIIKNALSCSKIVRIFEWIEEPKSIGHPHSLSEKKLNKWLGGVGKVEQLNESGCVGKAYYGIFKGKHYEEI